MALSSHQVRIARVVTVPEALGRIHEIVDEQYEKPHLILLDLALPFGDGLDVLRAVRSSRLLDDVPVVVLTGSESEEDRDLCLIGGCDEFIIKPADSTDLAEVVARLCDRFLYRREAMPA